MSLARDAAVFGSQGPVRKNLLINAAFAIAQRGTPSARYTGSTNGYDLDRWRYSCRTTANVQIAAVDNTGQGPAWYAKLTTDTADTSIAVDDYTMFTQYVEGLTFSEAKWGTADAKNLHASFKHAHDVVGTYYVKITNSATDRNIVYKYTQAVASVWETAEILIEGDTTGTWLNTNGIGLNFSFVLMCGTDYDDATEGVWGTTNELSDSADPQVNLWVGSTNAARFGEVMLEIGEEATDFSLAGGGHYQAEIELCERYYQRFYITSYLPIGVGRVTGAGVLQGGPIHLRVEMRTTPTVTCTSAAAWRCDTSTHGATSIGTRTDWFTDMGTRSIIFSYTAGTATNIYAVYFGGNVTVYVDSEL